MAEDVQFKVRLSADLKRKIDESRGGTGRSVNGEIVARLERTFIEDGALSGELASFQGTLRGLEARLFIIEGKVSALENPVEDDPVQRLLKL